MNHSYATRTKSVTRNASGGNYRRWPSNVIRYLILTFLAILMIYPLLWMISSSFKPETSIFSHQSLVPSQLHFTNYVKGWTATGTSFGVYLVNSIIVAALAVLGNLLSCSLVAYAFARLEFRGRRLWFTLMLGTVMLPMHVTLVPQYILFVKLGLADTFIPLVAPKFFAVDAFFVFMIVQFLRGIPREIDAAAMVDGAGPGRIYLNILLPQIRPALITVGIFTFIWTWNDFFSQLLYLSSPSKQTVPLGLQSFLSAEAESQWGAMFAMTTASLIPILIIFVAFQKLIVQGANVGGLKG